MIDDEVPIKIVANERAKLTAASLNGIAVDGFAPLHHRSAVAGSGVVPVMVMCWMMSGAIHRIARTSLRDMRP